VSPSPFATFRAQARGEASARFVRARRLPTRLTPRQLESADEADLWAAHAEAMQAFRRGGGEAPSSVGRGAADLLSLKVELGQRLLGPCRLCWLRCPVDRRSGETGVCRLGAGLRPYQDFVHLGEELELIPTQAVFLAGCNYRCVYCSDWDQVDRVGHVAEVEPRALARSIAARRVEGAASVSFIGGLPDVNLPAILQALLATEADVPVVWNTNLSGTDEAHDLLEGVVDAYVADLKYGSEACARAGSQVKGSLAVVHRQLRRVAREAYLIVRHLVLPGHLECCTLPALDWLGEHVPGARVNLMDQYTPTDQVRGTAWDRRPAAAELDRARAHAEALGLDLAGPGRLDLPARVGGRAKEGGRALPVAGFEGRITLGPDGEVTLENLPPELVGLIEALGDGGAELRERGEAGLPWRDPPGPP
jgi:putative pyruvate formate lyase activating enzyme